MSDQAEQVVPVQLSTRGNDELVIRWSDSQTRVYRWSELREHCPCAACRDRRAKPQSSLQVLSPAEAQPPRARHLQPVGQYAYQIQWNDGHSSGLYSFELLRRLGAVEGEQEQPGS